VSYRFTKFRLEDSPHYFDEISNKCPYDSVVIFDESYLKSNTSQDFSIFCGVLDKRLPVFISKTNTVHLRFVSDSIRGGEGFEAKIKFTYGRVVYFLVFYCN